MTRDYSEFPVQALRRTPEGYLTGRVRATCSGVFPYLADGGRTVNRLRPDAEVGDAESVRSLNSKPVTLRHPGEDVTPDNAKRLQVGFTGTDAEWDGSYVSVTVTVTDRDAIAAIEGGEVAALSCGYSADLSSDTGNWRGSAYDEVMSGIRYNHLALVKAGRAGDGVTPAQLAKYKFATVKDSSGNLYCCLCVNHSHSNENRTVQWNLRNARGPSWWGESTPLSNYTVVSERLFSKSMSSNRLVCYKPTNNAAVGNATQPVYVDADGRMQKCSGTLDSVGGYKIVVGSTGTDANTLYFT